MATQTASTDTLTVDTVGEIDNAWMNAGQPHDGLRMVTYRNTTLLTIPGDDNAPAYQYRSHDPRTGKFSQMWYHVSGPTLDEWYAEQDYRDLRDTEASIRADFYGA